MTAVINNQGPEAVARASTDPGPVSPVATPPLVLARVPVPPAGPAGATVSVGAGPAASLATRDSPTGPSSPGGAATVRVGFVTCPIPLSGAGPAMETGTGAATAASA